MKPTPSIIKAISKYRADNSMSQSQLAKHVGHGVNQVKISALERGKGVNPETLQLILKKIGKEDLLAATDTAKIEVISPVARKTPQRRAKSRKVVPAAASAPMQQSHRFNGKFSDTVSNFVDQLLDFTQEEREAILATSGKVLSKMDRRLQA